MKIKLKQKCNFLIKPSMMRDWYIIRESEKCYVISKNPDDEKGTYHLSKKYITEIMEAN